MHHYLQLDSRYPTFYSVCHVILIGFLIANQSQTFTKEQLTLIKVLLLQNLRSCSHSMFVRKDPSVDREFVDAKGVNISTAHQAG